MENVKEIAYMLELIDRPAFCVRDEAVCLVNGAASRLLLNVGQPVTEMLSAYLEEYRQLEQGVLHLPLQINGTGFTAAVKRLDRQDIFVLESESDQEQKRVMALAAMQLREPLSDVMASLSQLLPKEETEPAAREYRASLYRRLYQMHRMVCNMSDVSRYAQEQPAFSCRDISAVAEELFRKTQVYAAEKNICVEWECPKEQILTLVDGEKLERGYYNMVSNALKFSPEGERLQLSLKRRNDRLYLSVRDFGPGICEMGSIYTRYRRQPGLENQRQGLGLGFSLICAAAAAHGGTVLVDSPEGGGVRVTMSLAVMQGKEAMLRCARPLFDYAGEKDHALLELSDALPSRVWADVKE